MHDIINDKMLTIMLWCIIIIFGSIPLCIIYAILVIKNLATKLINSINDAIISANTAPHKTSALSSSKIMEPDAIRPNAASSALINKSISMEQIPNFKSVKSAGGFGSKVDQ